MQSLTEAQKVEFLEMEIRGRFLMMACDLEWTMLLIMTHCVPDPLIQRDFKEMTMHNKIECTIADLKKYKPDIYREYEKELEKLWEFKVFRNKISHRRMDFNKDLKSFRFQYVDVHEGKERIFEELFYVQDIYYAIGEFQKLNLTLAALFMKMTGRKINF
jgi:hypothetical protein